MATANDLIAASLRDIGVLAASESAPSGDAADALAALNRLLDQYATEPLNLYTTTRTTRDIVANDGEYPIGPVTGELLPVNDGFDTTWTGAPSGWTATTTGTGAIANDTSDYNAGGHSILTTVGASGTANVYRDFLAKSGESRTLSVYTQALSGGDAGVRIQNTDTTNYLTSAGLWQSAAADAIVPTLVATWEQISKTFTVESAAIVGAENSTLRVTLFSEGSLGGNANFDTFVFSAPNRGGVRPALIDHVTLIDTAQSPDVETPLTMFTEDGWAAVTQKALTSTQPTHWYYNPTFPYGTLQLWPIPTGASLQFAIYVKTQVSTFASLSTTVSLPPGYERMLVKNLALELCPSYSRQPSALLVKQASEATAAVKRANRRPTDLRFDGGALIGSGGAGWSIKTGS